MSRANSTTVLASASVALWLAAAPCGAAADAPLLVSPAGDTEAPAVVEPCPTLSWSGVSGAGGYRVQILTTEASGAEVLMEADVGDGRSWTPPRCLEEARDYAWRVRGLGEGWAGDWSRSAPFRVERRDTLRAALERVAERLAEERRLSAEELEWLRQAGLFDRRSTLPGAGPLRGDSAAGIQSRPAPFHATGDTAFHVGDQAGTGVVALGLDFGLYGEAVAPAGALVGRALAGTGVYALNENAVDAGTAPADTVAVGALGTGPAVGVKGTSVAPLGRGVEGRATLTLGFTQGVVGESKAIQGKGVEGRATNVDDTNYGVRAAAAMGAGDFYAGGAGVDYGPFTGSHLVRIANASDELAPGTVVSVTGAVEALERDDGSLHLSSTLPTVRLTDTPRDPTVLGAFVGEVRLEPAHPWSKGGAGRIGAVNALGEGRLWVTDANGAVAAGDYLTSSAVAGHAQRQEEPELMPYTVAKAIETPDWSTAEIVTVDGRTFRAVLLAVIYTGG